MASQQLQKPIHLAQYLFSRLRQLGVGAIHGVPGDYNLTALDYVEPAGLTWVGNCNELNAGYAADGYARIKGVGAIVTAFGVGELSALNAIAGSYAEKAAVVHIVGTPPTSAQQNRAILHHSLGDGDFRVFADMFAKVTVAQANLIDHVTATALIDQCLRECYLQSLPVYIELPTNMVAQNVEGTLLDTPIDLSDPMNDEGFEDAEVDTILDRIYAAKRPAIIVDGFVRRYRVIHEVKELVTTTGIPTFTTPFGKSSVDETMPNFHGVYMGLASTPEQREYINSADLILRLGSLPSDVNTFGFTATYPSAALIDFHGQSVSFSDAQRRGAAKRDWNGDEIRRRTDDSHGQHYRNLHLKGLLQKILARLDTSRLLKQYHTTVAASLPVISHFPLIDVSADDGITHATFWRNISPFFQPHDIIMTESGTASMGSRDFMLPRDVTLVNSSLWLSIGYMLGAAQGAAFAARDLLAERKAEQAKVSGRVILFEGDGSLQMTAQELSTIIRHKLDLVIFILNNNGYTIERAIHGMKAHYNDIQPWNYLKAGEYFGAEKTGASVKTYTARSWGELQGLMADAGLREGKGLHLVEVVMPQEDAPASLFKLVNEVKKRNRGQAEEKVPPAQAAS